jgi:hypothetical protein
MGKRNKQRRAQKNRDKARKRKRARQKANDISRPRSSPLVLRELNNPFGHLSDDERAQAIQAIAERSEEVYGESLKKLIESVQQYDPVILLSIIASYSLSVTVNDNGVQGSDSELLLYQSHVEFLQALMLQIELEQLEHEAFGPDVVQEAIDALVKLMQARNFRQMSSSDDGLSDDERAVRLIQQWMRGNTQMVRNWGYFSQVRTIGRELYAQFDDELTRAYGFSASNVIDVFHALIDEIERRQTNRFTTLSQLARLKDKRQLVQEYHRSLDLLDEQAQHFIDSVDIASISLETLFLMLVSHFDLRAPELYTILSHEVAEKLGISDHVVRKILIEFSMGFGELSDFPTEHLFLANPVWSRPVVRLESDAFVCVIPQAFFSFIFPALGRLVGGIDSADLSERRAEYLEDKIREITVRRFPTATTVSNIKWSVNQTVYETDLITCIDSHLLIIEAKSGMITDPALRGAPERLKKHIEEVLIAPNTQSKRLKNRLEELIADPTIEDDLRERLPVDLNTVHRVVRVSVSLADIGSLQANVVAQLKETGWLPEGYEACPSMTLADFETLFDVLAHPVQILHYLVRRQELEATYGYIGDELDLMGLYIDTLFNLGTLDPTSDVYISGMSARLDAYYNSKDAGVEIDKPQPSISKLFADILAQLEGRKIPRWTEIGVILHRFSPEDQRHLTKMIRELRKNVSRKWMIRGHENMAICMPPEASKYALAYVIYNYQTAPRRDEFVSEACRIALQPEHVNQCVVIAKNMDSTERSYDFIALAQ